MGKHRKPDIPDASRPYEEGYRKPPRKTQFQLGNTANPNGRPSKKVKTVGEQLEAILMQKVKIPIGGKVQSLSRQEVILYSITLKAMSGDVRATESVMRLHKLYHQDPAKSLDPTNLEHSDRTIIERYLEDFAREAKSLDGSYPDKSEEEEK